MRRRVLEEAGHGWSLTQGLSGGTHLALSRASFVRRSHATRLIEHKEKLGRGAKPTLFPLLVKSAAQHPINISTLRPPWHASPWISERQSRRYVLSEAIGGLPGVRDSTSMVDHPDFLYRKPSVALG